MESEVPLRVGLTGRHSARGKKKELVRGLQQLRGSWWRVLKIELILAGVLGSLLLCWRWTARYLHACIISSGVGSSEWECSKVIGGRTEDDGGWEMAVYMI